MKKFPIKKYYAFVLIIFILILLFFPNISFGWGGNSSKGVSRTIGDLYVAKWKSDRKSAFSFTFDDSYLSHFENARPILNQFGFKGTFYVLPLFLTDSLPGIWRYGTWPMFQAMGLEGHEIGSHSMTHPHLPELAIGDTNTEGTILYELYQSKLLIENRIPSEKCITFAYPFAEHNDLIDSLTALFYESARADGDTFNPPSLTKKQWYSLSAVEVLFDSVRNTPEDDLDELYALQDWIDSLISMEDWGILLAHEVVPFNMLSETPTWQPYTNEWFTDLCQWLKVKSDSKDLWISTIANITKYIKERDNYSYQLLLADENQIKLNISDDLEDEIYNFPLTAFVTVPDDWNIALMLQGNRLDTLQAINKDTSRIVVAEIIPDGGIVSLYKMDITNIENEGDKIPGEFVLYQNYPNPFNPTTKIKYSVPSYGSSVLKFVQLKIYDILGKEIATLVNEEKQPGIYEVEFSAIQKKAISSGVYFYRLRAGSKVITKKMILMK